VLLREIRLGMKIAWLECQNVQHNT
jgi:hypothetical protein